MELIKNRKVMKDKRARVSFSAQAKSQQADNHMVSACWDAGAADTLLTQRFRDRMMSKQKLIIMIDYRPARLVQLKKRWYFCYYQTNPTTGES